MNEKNTLLVMMLASVGLTAAFGVDIYLPSLPAMADYFHTSISQIQLTVSIYMLGFATGQLILGPLSDYYGRRPVLLICLFFYFLSSIVAILTNSLLSLILVRFLQAISACTGSVIVIAYIRDVMPVREGVKANSLISMTISLSPMLAPIIGGYLEYYFNWYANFILLAIMSGSLLIILWLFLPESLLYKNKETLHPVGMLKNYFSLFRNKDYRMLVFANTASFSSLFAFIATAPYLLIDLSGVKPQHFGYYFALNSLMLTITFFSNSRLANVLSIKQIMLLGGCLMFLGSTIMIVVSLLLPITALRVIIPMMVISTGIALLMPTTATSALLPYPKTAGSASAMTGFSRFGTAALVSTILGYFHTGSQLPLGIMIFCASIVVLFGIKKVSI